MSKKKKSEDLLIRRFNPDLSTGLTRDEEELRHIEGCTNHIKNETSKSYTKIIFGNIFTFFNFLMFSIAALFIIFVGPKSIGNMSFIVIVTVNILIGTIQECKSKHTIEKLRLTAIGKVKVKRHGEIIEILPDEVLLDDILVLSTGDQIPADCIIREGKLEVNESLLTGESRPVKKSEGDELFGGSFIVSGYGLVQVDKIAKDTYIYSIESQAKGLVKPKSKLMNSIRKLIKSLTYIIIPLGIITFWNVLVSSEAKIDGVTYTWMNAISESVSKGGSAMVGMIPAGMILLTSVAMAMGVLKLANKHTLVQDLYSVESLSRIDTLCLDKTGTLTDGTMVVENVIEYGLEDISDLIGSYLNAMKTENQTSKALLKMYPKNNIYKSVDVQEFSSEKKYSSVTFENGDTYMLGAPDFLLKDVEVISQARTYAEKGIRVLVLVKEGKKREIISMFLIRDNIRKEVKETMEWFDENGVDIYVISGDNISTVSYIAKQSGIKGWDRCVDMSTINDTMDVESIILNNKIFGRVSPEQKALIVDVLKKNGKTVGITGDGINDILAMKKSDCAIALENGVPATKNIANLILLDSNFNNMKDAVLEGRRVVNNVQRSTTLFLMKNFFIMFLIILSIVIGINFPIETSVMGLINIFLTGLGSLALSIEPTSSKIEGNFIKNILSKAIPAGFFLFIPCAFLVGYSFISAGTINTSVINDFIANGENKIIQMMAICITIAGFIVFFRVCRPFTKYRKIIFTILLSIVVILSLLIPGFFMNNSTNFWDFINVHNGFMWNVKEFLSRSSLQVLLSGFGNKWIIIAVFAILSSALYMISDRIVTKVLNVTLFSTKKYEDED